MHIHIHHHHPEEDEAPPWVERLIEEMGLVVEGIQSIMATLEELNAALATIAAEVEKVSADTDSLLAQLAAIPTGGLTPEQQAALDSAVSSATVIADRLKVIDDKVPDAIA